MIKNTWGGGGGGEVEVEQEGAPLCEAQEARARLSPQMVYRWRAPDAWEWGGDTRAQKVPCHCKVQGQGARAQRAVSLCRVLLTI